MRIDMVVIRHGASAPRNSSRANRLERDHGGRRTHEHPTQGLLDLLTLATISASSRNQGCIVGDVLHLARGAVEHLGPQEDGCEVAVWAAVALAECDR